MYSIDKFLDLLVPYYIYSIVLVHVLYVFLFIGILKFAANYLPILNICIQVFVCIFLILRFHPFRNHHFKEGDAHVIFGSATFLLLNLGFVEMASRFRFLPPKLEKIVNQ
uniref:Uncharacterized protein n=1 Tax=viral metagenome TaxID=1070528 RepID=A0A6C0JM35_9ZZZZ